MTWRFGMPSPMTGDPVVRCARTRRAFPHFYLFVMGSAAVAAALLWPSDPLGAGLLAVVALTTLPTRQMLMPAINTATDTGARARFKWLHGASVLTRLRISRWRAWCWRGS